MEELVICKFADHPACQNACDHSIEHEPIDEFDEGYCTESFEFCHEVDKDCVCLPTEAFLIKRTMNIIKNKAKNTARDILKGFEEI